MVVNIAVVGYGYWGPNLARNFSEINECKLSIICDKNLKKLTQAKTRFHSAQMSDDYDKVLNNSKIQAIVIATPVSSHYNLAKKALEHGKHVLIEKPLCTSVDEANKLIEIAVKKKMVLMVGHTFLYSPPVLKVKEFIDKRAIGRVYYIDSSRVNLGLFQPDVSVIWDLAPHDVSILLYWVGKLPLNVRATGSSYVRKEIEEVAFITLEFANGIMAHVHVSWLAPSKLRRTVVVGSKKMVVYDDNEPVEKIKIYNRGVVKNPETFGEFQLTYRSGDIISPHLIVVEPLKAECNDFISCIKTGNVPVANAETSALNVVKVLSAAEKSLRNNGQAVEIK